MTDGPDQARAPATAIVIDDQEDIRLLIRQLIEVDGDHVSVIAEAADGQTAIDMLNALDEGQPTVVVVDWMMPGLNGIETAKEIKRTRPSTRIILCSAFGGATLSEEAEEAGIDMFVSKDRIVELPTEIRALLDR